MEEVMEDWDDLEDLIDEAINDSIDMDWTSRIGARAVVAMLRHRDAERRAKRVCNVCQAVGDADHAGYCSESW